MIHNNLIASSTAGVAASVFGSMFAITEQVQLALISGAASLTLGLVTVYFAYKAKTISEATGKAVNGKMDEFKKMAEEFFVAKGVAEGKASAEAEAAKKDAAKAEGFAEAVKIKAVSVQDQNAKLN